MFLAKVPGLGPLILSDVGREIDSCQMTNASKNINAHLSEDIDDIDWHPVFGNAPILHVIEIHYAHADFFPRRRETKPVRAKMRSRYGRPSAGYDIVTIADVTKFVGSIPIGESAKKRNLVMSLKPL